MLWQLPMSFSNVISIACFASSIMVDDMSRQIVVTSASEAIESLAWRLSRCIYAYDVVLQHNFGVHAKEWRASGQEGPQVIEMQARSGAGLSIVGRMSEGTSSEASRSSFALSAFTTPAGLAQMMPAFANLPEPSMSNRLVVHVPCITTLDNSLALSPSLASIESILPIVPQNLAILASSTAQEAVDLALAAYRSTSSHVVHLFDHFSSARELRKLSIPTSRAYPSKSSPSLQEALNNAGYALFDYCGSRSAVEVFVAVNGILANTIKNSLKGNGSTGIVTVRLLRPWDGPKFLATLPQSARHIHVLDDVASPIVEGPLYNEVLSTFCEHAENVPEVSSVRITPTELESYLATTSELQRLLSTAVPSLFSLEPSARPTVLKRVAFWSTSGTLMTPLPEQIAQPLLNTNAIHARFLSASDVFAKPGGATLSRLTLSVAPTASDSSLLDAPMDIVMPLSGVDQDGADFTAILDPSLLKSHDVLRASLPGSPVLIYTNWSLLELVENLHPANTALARERDLQMYTLDTSTFGKDESQRALAHAAFLRLYVGGGATFDTFERISRAVIGDPVSGVSGRRLVSSVWDGLQKVILPQPTDLNTAADRSDTRSRETPPLRHFEFNTISLTGFTETVAKSERQGPISVPWHEAAKHILFREAYSTDSAPDSCVPTLDALRPEQPIQTYLVTCAVNQRLTPESYNRNVFHMEFDTSGTGLTYELGEALGVHGWNDDGDVLEFCEWYGVNPDMLISIPLPATQGGSGNGKEKMKVTRTVFQALQQQIDIFGRPGKSFFAALAIYATNRREKMALQFIAAPEGTATLKKLGEKDTVSCADVLALYPSARPSIEELAVIVGEIKERHYSIASAQSVVGDRVDLLVVTVDWVTPSGESYSLAVLGISAIGICCQVQQSMASARDI